MLKLFMVFIVIIFVITPSVSFAWGPAVHMGVSLSILEELPAYLKMLLFANLNEYLYGALAPDFIIGKNLSSKDKHSHNWDIGFSILHKANKEREKAFAYGYLTHLAADTVAHGIIVKNLDERLKNIRHTYIELVADSLSDNSYKELAKKVLSKYNSDLDTHLKRKVQSVLFSFSTSKLIFKSMVKVSLGRKSLRKMLFNPKVVDFFAIDMDSLKVYINLSRKFALNVLLKGEDSPVTKLDAVSE